ncbi:hypothetical protein FB451DRAFT_1186227 [Mycena latifolia]|nr:hypothetical protein FB451DRAFT_1186227 [Mycena latifolia]
MSSTSAFHAIVFSPSFRMYTTRVFLMATAMLIGSLTMLILSSTEALNIPTVWIALITNLCIIGHLIFIRRCCGPQLLEALLSYTSSCNIIPTSGRGPLWSVPSMRNTGITGTPIQAEVRFLWRLPSQPQSEEFLLGTSRPNGEAVDQDRPLGLYMNHVWCPIGPTGPQSGNWDKYNGVSVSLNFSQFSTNESTLAYVYVGKGDLNGINMAQQDPSPPDAGPQTASLRLIRLYREPSELLEEYDDTSVITGIFFVGGFWTVVNSVVVFLFGKRPLSAMGLLHRFQGRSLIAKWHEDFPAIRSEGGRPGTANAGFVAFLRERLLDRDVKDSSTANVGSGDDLEAQHLNARTHYIELAGSDGRNQFISAQLPPAEAAVLERMPTCMGNIGDSSDKERKGH